jgi:hypothetical protein
MTALDSAGGGGAFDFASDITRRAQWAIDHNDGRPEPVWSTGERLAVALVLRDKTTLEAEGYTRQDAARRLAGDLRYYGYSADADAWLREIRAAIESPRDVELPYTRCPSCGLAAQPGSMNYRLADGGIDWSGAMHASCGISAARTTSPTARCCPSTPSTPARDLAAAPSHRAQAPLPGCSATGAGVYGTGPGAASDKDRAYLADVERLHSIELRQAVLNARPGER